MLSNVKHNRFHSNKFMWSLSTLLVFPKECNEYTSSTQHNNTKPCCHCTVTNLCFRMSPCTCADLLMQSVSPPSHLFNLGHDQKMHIYECICTKPTNSRLLIGDNGAEVCNWYEIRLLSSWGAGLKLGTPELFQNTLSFWELVSLLNIF